VKKLPFPAAPLPQGASPESHFGCGLGAAERLWQNLRRSVENILFAHDAPTACTGSASLHGLTGGEAGSVVFGHKLTIAVECLARLLPVFLQQECRCKASVVVVHDELQRDILFSAVTDLDAGICSVW
jgi:hypothetical protein